MSCEIFFDGPCWFIIIHSEVNARMCHDSTFYQGKEEAELQNMHNKDFFPTSRIFIFMTKLGPNKLCIAFIKLNEILDHTAIDMFPEPTALQQFPQTIIFVSFDTINISIYLYSKCFLSQFYLNFLIP